MLWNLSIIKELSISEKKREGNKFNVKKILKIKYYQFWKNPCYNYVLGSSFKKMGSLIEPKALGSIEP